MSPTSLEDEKYMLRCIQLARNGFGTTYPNPMVGCVIVHKKKIIGEGWHYISGEPHAEVMAIRSVKDKELLKDATIYVSLEPCSYTGKTPPCSDLIIEHKIPRVVIGSSDPHPNVSGKGIERLKNAGIEVLAGVCKSECDVLNKRFFTFHTKKRPYIILKWAATKDGFIAPLEQNEGEPFWITSPISKQLVHLWRSQEASIMVGTNTAIKDNPRLDTREVAGNNPVRLTIDKDLRIPSGHALLKNDIPTVIFTFKAKKSLANLHYEKLDPTENIPKQMLSYCYNNNLQSIIIEGGTSLLQSYIDLDLWDEARVFTGKSMLENGILQPILNAVYYRKEKSAEDTLCYYRNVKQE
ncbi:MAG TPA: bifunctional diaminohydroxyphosphoribosylaminopyrimidine deaminase/5-amino-6-(5-phosphoribosylamino)uracil reductase RibD [Flavobacteriaceae bacterium]|nr:bifunctional diaminohydroxyphosphoribosylaminopyrimidine deaminase/5-amino-6-(5-phosphoribosylamino)uracil reductase RibD [Flavobacteriaceae bacterium]